MKYKWINELKRINELYEMNGQSEYYNGRMVRNENIITVKINAVKIL